MAETSTTSANAQTSAGAAPPAANAQSKSDVGSSGRTNAADLRSNPDDPLGKDSAPKQEAQPVDDDPEFDFDGEKFRKSQLKDVVKKRKEFDRAAHMRMQEAAEAKKQWMAEKATYDKLADQIKQDPWALLDRLGLDGDELAEQRLTKSLQRARMSPEEIQLETARNELQSIQQQKAEFERQQQQAQHQALTNTYLQQLDADIGSAMKLHQMPKSPRTVARIAGKMEEFLDAGQPIDAATAAQMVRREIEEEYTPTFLDAFKANPEQALAMLGPEIIKAINAHAVQKAQAAQPNPLQQKVSQPRPQPKPKAPPTFEDVRKNLGIRRY